MKYYIDYDEYGISEIRCMCCGTPVAVRGYVEMPDKKNHSKTVRVLAVKRNASWGQTRVKIDVDGVKSFVDPIVCIQCLKEKDLQSDEMKALFFEHIRYGWRKSLESAGKSETDIEEYLNRYINIKAG